MNGNAMPTLVPVLIGALAAGIAIAAPPDNEPLVGIGAALRSEDGRMLVTKILPDTPAAASALRPDDQLVAVGQADRDPVDVSGMSVSQVVAMVRGRKGTAVRLTIVPKGKAATEARVITLVRGEIATAFGDGRLLPVGEWRQTLRTRGCPAAAKPGSPVCGQRSWSSNSGPRGASHAWTRSTRCAA